QHPRRARPREQAARVRDHEPRRRLQSGGVEEVLLQVDEEEDRPHGVRRARLSTRSAMRRPISSVPTTRLPGPATSKVRNPESRASAVASSIHAASRWRPKLSRSNMASEEICPIGLARSFPARSRAEPWLVWYTAAPLSEKLPENDTPREDSSTAPRSASTSPKRFDAAITSNSRGS